MSSYRNLVILLLVLLLAGGGLAIWNAEHKIAKHPPKPVQPNAASAMIGKNVSFTVTEGEVKKWKIDATKAIYNENRTVADLTDVRGEFYNEKGEPIVQFTAPTGKYTTRNNAVTLSGGVVAKSTKDKDKGGKGGTMLAPTMVWSARTNRVKASGGVDLTFPEGHSTAQVCNFTLDFSDVILEGGVSSTLTSQ